MSDHSKPPKITVITAVYNRERTIAQAIESVLNQRYPNLEYIVIDGHSNDGTQGVIENYLDRIDHYVSEPDEGIYQALNKGIRRATGEVIGFLHSDDVMEHNGVISRVAEAFQATGSDAIYGEALFVDGEDITRVRRYWKSRPYRRSLFFLGWMPPHTACYIRKKCYDDFGAFGESLTISADYELLVRHFVKHEISATYVPEVFVRMRVGGVSNSSLKNRRLANREDATVWPRNGLKTPFGLRLTKPLGKFSQFWSRPPKS